MEYVFPPAPRPSVPVRGSKAGFPTRRVWCVGRNYADHAKEMGASADGPPVFFLKPGDALDASGLMPYPPMTGDAHHEIELAVALSGGGRDLTEAQARAAIWGYGVALDMTRRDLQAQAKADGRPWELGKSFDGCAPISPLFPAEMIGHPRRGRISLSVNGTERQRGDLSEMIRSPEQIMAELSRFVALAAGDVILTGTPAGVGPVARGDVLEGFIEHVGSITLRVS